MSVLGTIAHALGANGYVKDEKGDRYSFANKAEGIYLIKSSIVDPPGSGQPRQVFFANPFSAVVAALATSTGGKDVRVVNTRPGN